MPLYIMTFIVAIFALVSIVFTQELTTPELSATAALDPAACQTTYFCFKDSNSTKTTSNKCLPNHLCFKEDRMHACCRPLLSVFKDYEYDNKRTIKMVQERCGLYYSSAKKENCWVHCPWTHLICDNIAQFIESAKCVKQIENATLCEPFKDIIKTEDCTLVSNWTDCVVKHVTKQCGDLGRDIAMQVMLKHEFEQGDFGYFSGLTFSGKMFESDPVCLTLLNHVTKHATLQHPKKEESETTDELTEETSAYVTESAAAKTKSSIGFVIIALFFSY